MRKPPPPQRELFGAPPAAVRDQTPVELYMREVSKGTEKAYHLALIIAGPGARDGFAPRALVTRGEGPGSKFFTMPKWLARERGWL